MSTMQEAYQSIANINLWFKIQDQDELMLADIPEIIPLRWTYLRDNWEFIRPTLVDRIDDYYNPSLFTTQIAQFDAFIASQRNVTKRTYNPLTHSDVFYRYYTIFDNLTVASINLTNEESSIINDKLAKVANYSKNDFIAMREKIKSFRDNYADSVNLSDPSYNSTNGRSSTVGQLSATIADSNQMLTLNRAIGTINFILSNLYAVDTAIDPFALARANANNPNINIESYASGNLVKLNYGEDLRGLARRYLDDPDKWIDIAIANGLKPPYIDEVGEKIPLISNGSANQINIGGTDFLGNSNIDKLYINQIIYLQSSTQTFADQRKIINISKIPVSGDIIIELDGNRNLDIYKIIDGAYIRVFKPHTTNSSFFILIPSTEPLANPRREEVPWFLASTPESERQAGTDISIDDNGDLIFSSNGDIRLSYGLENALQAIKLKFMTELGSNFYHPDFGLVNVVGMKTNDMENIKDTLVRSITDQIERDPRFGSVQQLTVDFITTDEGSLAVNAVLVQLIVQLAGSKANIPISFSIKL